MSTKPTSETELYGPVRDLLVDQGFDVQAEVDHCDVAAVRGEELVVVELKLRFSVDLLAQASERLSITDLVYVAIPRPAMSPRGRKWSRNRRLLRRLGLGLLVVDYSGQEPWVDVVLESAPFQSRKSKRRKGAIMREIAGRSGDHNTGGSTGKALITAYREDAIFLACALRKHGPQTAVQLRKIGAANRARLIMYHNHYGWFERLGRGLYQLTQTGVEQLGQFPALVDACEQNLKE